MKRVLYLSFYFEPDLSAGSFRNSSLAKEVARQLGEGNEVVLIATLPNRYSTFRELAQKEEQMGNLKVYRVSIPDHQSGFKDQIESYRAYFKQANEIARKEGKFDLVFASSGRLFTGFLASRIAKKQGIPFYLDIRDIFVDTMKDVLQNPLVKSGVLPVLKMVERITFNRATHINLISGGFKPYFSKFKKPQYSEFTNGIDEVFLDVPRTTTDPQKPYSIVYAGNIGEGQGLHKIIPSAAKQLGGDYKFIVVGDGGAKGKLLDALNTEGVTNVELKDPVKRNELIELYAQSDFLFMHLNDYAAFKKVLPSKVFELSAYDKPLIAGVGGYAASFVKEHVSNSMLFAPGDVDSFVNQMKSYTYQLEFRSDFIGKFKRSAINEEMAKSILSYLK